MRHNGEGGWIHGATPHWDGGEKERGPALVNGTPCLAHPRWLTSTRVLSNWPGFAANQKSGTKCDLNVLQLNYLTQNLAGATGTGAGARRMNQIISLENGLIFNYEMGHFGGRR